jgi:predicted MFS family arabinose efflux permease
MTTPTRPESAPPPSLTPGLLALLTLTMFFTAGTVHFQTPMLTSMAAEFGVGAAAAGWVPTLSFGGFLAGTILLVPLGDRLDKRRLFLAQFALTIAALLAMASAPSLAVLVAASFVVGIGCSSSSQNVIPMVAELTRPGDRGRIVGTLLTGLFMGILFARVAGGFVAAYFGWRWMYVYSAATLLVLLPVLYRHMPKSPPSTRLPYFALLGSIGALLRTHADLRRVAVIQAMLGITYGGFWATIAAMLLQYHQFGPAEAGLMGIPGAAGILIARPAGRWMDRRGVTPVVTTGICLVLAAYASFAFAGRWVAAAVAGAILLDCGLRAAMVANQTLINTIAPEARSRSNTIFSASVWGGNALGAFIASAALAQAGWLAVCGIIICAPAIALVVQWRSAPPRH